MLVAGEGGGGSHPGPNPTQMAAVSCREEVPLPCRLSEGGSLKGHVLARWPRPIGPTRLNLVGGRLVSVIQRKPTSTNCGGEFFLARWSWGRWRSSGRRRRSRG